MTTAKRRDMATLRLVAALAFAASACVQQQYSDPSTMPQPMVVVGPPGGEMDPEWGPRSSGDYADATVVEPSQDPTDPGYAMGTVTDAEITMTLEGYGEWVDTDDYGEVWRPYATDVGVDFTPYESCGSWVWTDWGWTFTCDYAWGWLPFHYGTWGWFDDYWAWVPDTTWTPAAVDWRSGGGFVGWRPKAPRVRDHRGQGPNVRDHRVADRGPNIRDHRGPKQYESHWRFATETDFGKPHIRAHVTRSPAEGLRMTQVVSRPALRGSVQAIRAASLMRSRFANPHVRAQIGTRPATTRPLRKFDRSRPPVYDRNPSRSRAFDRAFSNSQQSVYQPGYVQPSRPYVRPRHDHAMPAEPITDSHTQHPLSSAPASQIPDPPTRAPITTPPMQTPPPSQVPTWTRPTTPPPPSQVPTWTRPSAPSSWTPPASRAPSSSSSGWTPPASRAPSSSSWTPPASRAPSSSSWTPSRAPSTPPSAPMRSGGSVGGGVRRH